MVRVLGATLLLATALSARSAAQSRPDGWYLGGAGNLLAAGFGTDNQTLGGPSLQLGTVRPGRLGIQAATTYLVPTGRYDLTGAALELGLGYGIPAGDRSVLVAHAGLAGVIGGDNDGGAGAAAAVAAGLALVTRLHGRLGLRLDLAPKLWINRGTPFTFGASAGLVLLRGPR
ncbi:MAG: hypothetical protein AB7R55_04915 [Gemmatimonadales bacterium]